MRYYSSLGYYLIGLSPVLALVLFLSITLPSVGTLTFSGVPFQWFLIEVAIPTVSVEAIGFVLYLSGRKRDESLPFSLGLNIFLVLWGVLTVLFGRALYGALLDWANLAHVALTAQSYPEIMTYATIVALGFLWFGWGIALTVAHLLSSRSAS